MSTSLENRSTDTKAKKQKQWTHLPGQPFVSFMGQPTETDLERLDAEFAILGVPFGSPYHMQGVASDASNAPAAVRASSYRFGSMLSHHDFDFGEDLFGGYNVRLMDCGDVIANPRHLEDNKTLVTEAVRTILSRGALPIVLGGDDSIPPLILRAYEGHESITVLQFDAHLDYRDEVKGIRDGYSSPMRRAAEMPNWLARFIDIRGWAQPDEVRAAMQAFAEKFTRRASAQEIDVPSPTSSYQAPARTVPPLPERFSGIVTRLEHVQLHSDRMGNEGVARREAFHLADHALHGTPRAHQLRQWGMDVGDLASPSQVMAIGRTFDRAKAESLLPELPSASLSSLESDWREVFAVSRAIHDVDLLDAAHAIHSSKRAERLEAELSAQTAPVVEVRTAPDNDIARETAGSAIGVDLLRSRSVETVVANQRSQVGRQRCRVGFREAAAGDHLLRLQVGSLFCNNCGTVALTRHR